MSKYQCEVHLKLVHDSLEDIDNRVLRRKVIDHSGNCDHPVCIQVHKTMKAILNQVREEYK